jgi:acetyltransferase-like isoleucine patch superfamily enzyme
LKVRKGKGAKLILRGDLRIASYQGDRGPVVITMGENSTFQIDGDFMLTQGTKIVLCSGAHLHIGGDRAEKGCGTTGNCRIMVKKKVHIGKDFLCSWNVFITDHDWHTLNGGLGQKDTYIGDHV